MYKKLTKIIGNVRFRERGYSTRSPFLFIPNEEKYQFESEKLTPEENRAAIPKRPNYDHLPKYHHEIAGPDSIADVIVNADFKDIFLTSLAKDSPFTGDLTYKLVSKDTSIPPESVKLYFTATTCRWIEVFKKQIFDLSHLPVQDSSLSYENKNVVEQIEKGLKKLERTTTGANNLFTMESLQKFYTYLKAFENSAKKIAGASTQSELSPAISFEAVSSYLLNSEEIKTSGENFDTFIVFVEENIQLFNLESLKEFLILLINNLHESKLSTIQMKLNSFTRFMDNTVFEIYPSITSELSPIHLDKLAYLYTMTSNILKANEILSILVQDNKILPSEETFNSFMSCYQKNLDSNPTLDAQKRRESVLRDLSNLKPIFFHDNLSSISFNVLLNNAVSSIYDLEKFLKMVSSSKNGATLLTKFSLELLRKLEYIHSISDDTYIAKSLQLSQFLRTLVVENDIKLNENALDLSNELYSKYNQKINVEALKSL